ncbi:MAG: NYN domain-containing protein, partial [Rhodobacteraceae bacterium]|nr:NYN domain-containing protein [Paracoccaceae bacterium]
GIGKNAADLLLSIEAMELAMSQAFSSVVIASSDGDFTHLATRLRERGLCVIGVGEDKAPKAFRGACTRFDVVGARTAEAAPAAPKPVPAAERPVERKDGVSDLDLRIRDMIRQHSTKAQGMRITDLNPAMSKAHGTRISLQPERSWRAYLAARPALYDLDPRGPEAKVRFRPAGFA